MQQYCWQYFTQSQGDGQFHKMIKVTKTMDILYILDTKDTLFSFTLKYSVPWYLILYGLTNKY